ncbi:MAG: DNA pilot protein [Wigfec virus K19_180]|nr:MAG: DNA pilot protein [Wigfec virus K19_180]
MTQSERSGAQRNEKQWAIPPENLNPITMDPITGAALIGAGISATGSAANAYAQGKMNKKTREWNEKMYAKQREDNLSQWHMQNDYNSPTAQMARLRESGLNPNLVYGNGAVANNSQSMPNVSPASWNPKAPEVAAAATNTLGTYFDVKTRQAQYDNLKATNTAIQQDAILKAATTAATNAKTSRTQFDLKLAQDLRDVTTQAAQKNLLKLTGDAGISMANASTAEGRAGFESPEYDKSYNKQADTAKLVLFKEQNKNTKAGTELRELEADLNRKGITKSDPIYMRVIARFLDQFLK